ncbi:hypothetical protein Sme01_21020 [Sphaerisporangium melleum]|uniref:Nucleotidyltransferase n=1 Tax=Sphaerisporangium melleum TaxID=321316 RepID=A0A917VUP5_9ACTN|nr:hypothetical protein [Sphaerisporangium melleum]GGL15915.1 hypothetical protein GCM10007964_67380 [Sphaerisporangium melleum]GII69626.1 hypothetical protein Sme01_21020 [Sphaerisporangium melleum]
MNRPGVDRGDILVRSRFALLDALSALDAHRDAVIVIGAQAVYLRTMRSPVALAETTKDSDLALDPRVLEDEPLLERSMSRAGFYRDPADGQPGAWLNAEGIPVDLMVPEALAGPGTKNTRGARIPPHDRRATRRARGLEAAVIDNSVMDVAALDPDDDRAYRVRVAGPAALLVAKLHKISERHISAPHRLNDKDAHDIYRILIDADTSELAAVFNVLQRDSISSETTSEAIEHLAKLFAQGPDALGARMAGRAEEGIGEPETVALATSLLAADLVQALQHD